MKKLICLAAAALLMLFCFTGCGNKNTTDGDTVSSNSSSGGALNSMISDAASNMSYSATDIINTVKAAYGSNYYPDTAMLEDRLNEEFPIDKSLVKEIKAEMPTLGDNPDRLVAVVANEGKGSEVEAALNAAKTALISATPQGDESYAKVNTSRVVRNGDYVCYIMLGENKDTAGFSDSVKLDSARTEMLKGVTAFESMFKTT